MRFLCDVHIAIKIVKWLQSKKFEATHVNSILKGSSTSDNEIRKFADENNYIIITKDRDFKNSFFINKTPQKLVKINLGNISNEELINILNKNISTISFLNTYSRFFLELGNEYPFYYCE